MSYPQITSVRHGISRLVEYENHLQLKAIRTLMKNLWKWSFFKVLRTSQQSNNVRNAFQERQLNLWRKKYSGIFTHSSLSLFLCTFIVALKMSSLASIVLVRIRASSFSVKGRRGLEIIEYHRKEIVTIWYVWQLLGKVSSTGTIVI